MERQAAPTGLLSPQQAAERLGVSQKWLEQDRSAGARIPFVRVGRRCIRYSAEALDRFIQANTFTSTSEYREGAA
jgi:excisionase family DNA binding protein